MFQQQDNNSLNLRQKKDYVEWKGEEICWYMCD